MTVKIGCIVEGHGEVKAVPVLIRKIAGELFPELPISVPLPIRVPRTKLVQDGELKRSVELAARKVGKQGALFILLDSDRECPAVLGPELLQKASRIRSDLLIAVVLAKCEFEAWFLAAAESLQGERGLKSDIRSPSNPEGIRDAKGWLSQQMENNRNYRETHDQPAFTERFDFNLARSRAGSFEKCYRDIVHLLEELRKASVSTND